jgi:peptidoglycan/LPS O-acetylase OafA/YrhL
MKNVSSPSRIEWLDSLRGIASLLVVFLHYYHRILLALIPMIAGGTYAIQELLEKKIIVYTIDFYKNTIFYDKIDVLTPFIYGYWDLGKVGVVSFFFISGYVIAYTLNKLDRNAIRQFVVGRFFRLYPVFWVALLLMIILRALSGHLYDLKQILANLTMFNKFLLIPDINGVAWTLQIELTFYIMAAVFFGLGISKDKKYSILTIYLLLLLAFVMAVLKQKTGIDLPLAFPLGLSVMFTGWYWRLSHDLPNISQKGVGIVALSFLPVWGAIFYIGYAPHAQIYFNSYLVGMILVALFALCRIQHPILRFLGNISYSLYLIHDVIGMHVFPWLMSLYLPQYAAKPYLTVIPFFITLTLTIFLSTLLYYFVEKPGVNLGREVNKRLKERMPKAMHSPAT